MSQHVPGVKASIDGREVALNEAQALLAGTHRVSLEGGLRLRTATISLTLTGHVDVEPASETELNPAHLLNAMTLAEWSSARVLTAAVER